MEFTGERYIPGILDNTAIAFEHWQRYIAASKMVKDKMVLDIACGEGYGSHFMAQSALQVYAVDISSEAIEHASNKYVRNNLTYQCGSVDKLDFADESIDIIISFETIEHVDVEMQKAFIREAKRILRKDGILLISCPNKKVATDFAWDVWQYKNEFHIKEYYIEEFQTFLKSYFEHVQLAFQRYEIALLLSSGNAANLEVVMGNDNDFEHTQNIIAVCSNSRNDSINFDSIVLRNNNQYLNNLNSIAMLQKENAALQSNNTDLHNQNVILQNLADELHRIYNTRSWKLLNTAYNIKSKFFK